MSPNANASSVGRSRCRPPLCEGSLRSSQRRAPQLLAASSARDEAAPDRAPLLQPQAALLEAELLNVSWCKSLGGARREVFGETGTTVHLPPLALHARRLALQMRCALTLRVTNAANAANPIRRLRVTRRPDRTVVRSLQTPVRPSWAGDALQDMSKDCGEHDYAPHVQARVVPGVVRGDQERSKPSRTDVIERMHLDGDSLEVPSFKVKALPLTPLAPCLVNPARCR
jgi:hypothetical protein